MQSVEPFDKDKWRSCCRSKPSNPCKHGKKDVINCLIDWLVDNLYVNYVCQAEKIVNVIDVDAATIVLSHRLTPLNAPPIDIGTTSFLILQEILIVGNCNDQVNTSSGGEWFVRKFTVNYFMSWNICSRIGYKNQSGLVMFIGPKQGGH